MLDAVAYTALFSAQPIEGYAGRLHCLGPASAGDLTQAVGQGYKVIILSDTLFLDAPPPHTELLGVIRSGVQLIGCASAGALRATELYTHGMIGYGAIYNMYRKGSLMDDGELAVVFSNLNAPMAPPLIEIRYCLGAAIANGHSRSSVDSAFRVIQSVYFMRRTSEFVDSVLEKYLGIDRTSIHAAQDERFRLKTIDLRACLGKFLGLGDPISPHQSIDQNWLNIGSTLGTIASN